MQVMLRGLNDSLLAFVRSHRTDIAIVFGLTAVAAALRVVALGDIPPGLHGDEAIAGLEARHLLDEGTLRNGLLSPFSPGARGVPAGTFYWTAGVFMVAGESVFTLRLAYALLGVLTVVVSYATFAVMFDRKTGALAALLLAVSVWHLHFSRTAFIPIGWPLVQMATLLFLFLAVRRDSPWLFGAAGLCLGAGVYTYQAFMTFAASLALVLVLIAVYGYRRRLFVYVARVAVLVGAALFAALPMASFAWHNSDIYTERYRNETVRQTDEYNEADNLFAKAGVVLDRERDYLWSLVDDPVPDGVDAAGAFPLFDPATAALIVAGGLLALYRAKRIEYAAVLVIACVIAIGPAYADGGWYRRTLGLAPLISLLAALPLVALWDVASKRSRRLGLVAGVAAGISVVAIATFGLVTYFTTYDDETFTRATLSADLAEASEFMDALPDDAYVLFYNQRSTFNYETRLFIAPDANGEGRTRNEAGGPSLIADRSRKLAYIFVGEYANLLPQVEQLYPGGMSHIGRSGNFVSFAAYILPRSQEVENPDNRDQRRTSDLATVRSALEEYRIANGSYPSTNDAVQTLCALDIDAACALGPFLNPLPLDPLSVAAGGRYFYYYRSDGQSYALFAQREGANQPACPERPAALARFDSVLCVSGP